MNASDRGRSNAPRTVFPLAGFVRFLARERHWLLRLWWLLAPLALATALTYVRVLLGFGSTGLPLIFYFPAIIVTTLIAGLDFGIAAIVGSLLLVWFLFAPPPLTWQPLTRDQAATFVLWVIVSAILACLSFLLRTALRQLFYKEMRYRHLVELTSDIVWVTDAEGRALAENDAFARITGMQWPDYGGRKWLKGIHEDDRPTLMPSGARAAEYHEVEFRLKDAASGDWRWFRSRAVAIKTPEGETVEWITAMRDVHEPRIARERNAILLGEARHRLKNLIAIIAALATSSRPPRGESNPQSEEFLKRFLGRLHALGAAADLALAGDNRVMELGEAIEATLAAFSAGNARIEISGPRAILGQETGGSIALAVHELATNAVKYGALSVPEGSVSLSWSVTPLGENERIEIVWKETGGPSVNPPDKEGYGYRVIRAAVARGREGRAEILYTPEGLSCELSFVQPAIRDAAVHA
jgi:PAS domain S-box-containing protein